MNYVWEILLRAQECGLEKKDLFFTQARQFSPWYEQAFSCINENEVCESVIELNTLCRFSAIFQSLLFHQNRPQLSAYLLDLAVHLLAEAELLTGLTVQDYYVQKLTGDIAGCCFGPDVAQTFQQAPAGQQRAIAQMLLRQYQLGSSLLMFRRALTAIYPECMLYQLREEPDALLLYMGRPATEASLLQMLAELFLPITYTLRVFWEHHFGVIGVEATMQMDELELF